MRGLLAAGALLAGLLPLGAQADTRTLSGGTLMLNLTGSQDVTVVTEAGRGAGVEVDGDGLNCLGATGGGQIAIDTSGCGSDLGDLIIRVPTWTPLTLTSRGNGDIRLGDLRGPVSVTLAGRGDLRGGTTGPLKLVVTSSGDATFGEVDGPASVQIDGSGDVKIGNVKGLLEVHQTGSGNFTATHAQLGAAELNVSGNGDASIGEGNIAALRVRVAGAGDVSIAASVFTADLQASGGGDVRVAQVRGPVQRNASDGSTITVGGNGTEISIPPIPPVPPIPAFSTSFSDNRDGDHGRNGVMVAGVGDAVSHVISGIIVAVLGFFAWRTIRRHGGLRAWNASRTPAPPTHSGVLALRETLARVEERLGRVEFYVTSREFELQRKFSELESKEN